MFEIVFSFKIIFSRIYVNIFFLYKFVNHKSYLGGKTCEGKGVSFPLTQSVKLLRMWFIIVHIFNTI